MNPLLIRSGQGSYPVEFVDRVEDVAAALAETPRAVAVIDERVAQLYGAALQPLRSRVPVLEIPATEDEKSLAGVARVCTFMQERGCSRSSTLIAIGGGIVQDIVAFCAHVYYRGVRWIFAPTTLLAMSDSCIGAKCGLNLNSFKNQLGVFHSPSRVLIAAPFTATLSDADVASGYGEILKLALTGSAQGFAALSRVVEEGGLRDPRLPALIRASLQIKQGFIEQDELDVGVRRLLNYGHTFGHALEAATRHEVPHGLAVAWGLDLINFLSVQRGLLEQRLFEEVHGFIRAHLRFRRARPVSAGELLQGARRDKKASEGHVDLVLCAGLGQLRLERVALDAALQAQVAAYLEQWDVSAAA